MAVHAACVGLSADAGAFLCDRCVFEKKSGFCISLPRRPHLLRLLLLLRLAGRLSARHRLRAAALHARRLRTLHAWRLSCGRGEAPLCGLLRPEQLPRPLPRQPRRRPPPQRLRQDAPRVRPVLRGAPLLRAGAAGDDGAGGHGDADAAAVPAATRLLQAAVGLHGEEALRPAVSLLLYRRPSRPPPRRTPLPAAPRRPRRARHRPRPLRRGTRGNAPGTAPGGRALHVLPSLLRRGAALCGARLSRGIPLLLPLLRGRLAARAAGDGICGGHGAPGGDVLSGARVTARLRGCGTAARVSGAQPAALQPVHGHGVGAGVVERG